MSDTMRKEMIEWGKALLWAIIIALVVRTLILDAIWVDGESMEPFLLNRERVFVNRLVYRFSPPEQNDVVIVNGPTGSLVKRVMATAGQTIAVRDGQVFLDGSAINEPYLQIVTLGTFGPYTVPAGTVFVMGDNRNLSLDSRDPSIGPIPLGKIRGKAMLVYWPLNRIRVVKH